MNYYLRSLIFNEHHMLKLASAVRIMSSIAFVGILLLAYGYLLDGQTVYLERGGVEYINTERFFYVGLIVFVIMNTMLYSFIKISTDIKPGKSKGWFFISEERQERILIWLNFFNASVNILLGCAIGYILSLNAPSELNLEAYAFLFLIGPVLVFIVLVLLPITLIKQ